MTENSRKPDSSEAGPPPYLHTFRVDERLFERWRLSRGLKCKKGGYDSGLVYHHALAELLEERAPAAFCDIRHHLRKLSITFYSPFHLNDLSRSSSGRGTRDIVNAMKFTLAYCTDLPAVREGDVLSFLTKIRPVSDAADSLLAYDHFDLTQQLLDDPAQATVKIFCHHHLKDLLADCGVLVSSDLLSFKQAFFCEGGIACEQPLKNSPSAFMRGQIEVRNVGLLYEKMLNGIGDFQQHGYGMLRMTI
ncbi:MAG: hypothetical protein J0I80_08020 [Sphingomonas sp.]|nr:hypothetical protein [Sphingomonas sp.]